MPQLDPDEEAREHHREPIGNKLARTVVELPTIQSPPPRATWRDEVVQSYDAFWQDVSAKAAREIDLTVIFRYFDINELIARLYDEVIDASLTIETNSGSLQTHPHLAAIARLTTTALKLANEIGATPMSRLKLGLTKMEGALALQRLEDAVGGELDRQAELPEDERDDILDAEVLEHEY